MCGLGSVLRTVVFVSLCVAVARRVCGPCPYQFDLVSQ